MSPAERTPATQAGPPVRTVLCLYTGGTIGMRKNPETNVAEPVPGFLSDWVQSLPMFHDAEFTAGLGRKSSSASSSPDQSSPYPRSKSVYRAPAVRGTTIGSTTSSSVVLGDGNRKNDHGSGAVQTATNASAAREMKMQRFLEEQQKVAGGSTSESRINKEHEKAAHDDEPEQRRMPPRELISPSVNFLSTNLVHPPSAPRSPGKMKLSSAGDEQLGDRGNISSMRPPGGQQPHSLPSAGGAADHGSQFVPHSASHEQASEKRRIHTTLVEYNPLLDSSNFTHFIWQELAEDIYENYEHFDGFVILHGTDTMAFTATALAFFFERLNKPVIFTGSQIPMEEQRNDGLMNFIGALQLAAFSRIGEVMLYFDNVLYRGCRTTKVHTSSPRAFDSPNLRPLCFAGIRYAFTSALQTGAKNRTFGLTYENGKVVADQQKKEVNSTTLFSADQQSEEGGAKRRRTSGRVSSVAVVDPPPPAPSTDGTASSTGAAPAQEPQVVLPTAGENAFHQQDLRLLPLFEPRISILRIFPGLFTTTAELIHGLKGLVLQTFGEGNAPNNQPYLLNTLRDAIEKEQIVVVNVTQCLKGGTPAGSYATGAALTNIGVLPAYDMTPEAALVKLGWLLGLYPELEDRKKVKQLFQEDLRGELTQVWQTNGHRNSHVGGAKL
ncbi:unnamed protein product [Amoebophrya sp. A120]|nr:unnamed protein product [Amoebophrya sp. A120]|eukprot:GSA120T00024703001.1